MFKPYLSESSASEYAKPLISFYKIVIAEALEDPEADVEDLAAVEKLKQEFEEVLEIEESKWISHTPISVEPSTWQIHMTEKKGCALSPRIRLIFIGKATIVCHKSP